MTRFFDDVEDAAEAAAVDEINTSVIAAAAEAQQLQQRKNDLERDIAALEGRRAQAAADAAADAQNAAAAAWSTGLDTSPAAARAAVSQADAEATDLDSYIKGLERAGMVERL